jgi:hypothetical protein
MKNKAPQIDSFVCIGLQTLLIEDIDIEAGSFFGSDADGDARWYRLDQIDAVIP